MRSTFLQVTKCLLSINPPGYITAYVCRICSHNASRLWMRNKIMAAAVFYRCFVTQSPSRWIPVMDSLCTSRSQFATSLRGSRLAAPCSVTNFRFPSASEMAYLNVPSSIIWRRIMVYGWNPAWEENHCPIYNWWFWFCQQICAILDSMGKLQFLSLSRFLSSVVNERYLPFSHSIIRFRWIPLNPNKQYQAKFLQANFE